jgi:hypothetical protein
MFNARLAARLEEVGYRAFLPQRDSPPGPDGTAWGIGYAFARGRPVVGPRTDRRIFGREEQVDLMIEQSLTALAHSVDEAVAKLRALAPPGGGARDRTAP